MRNTLRMEKKMSYLGKFSLANRSLIALATIAILLFGALVIPSLKEELFPSLPIIQLAVTASEDNSTLATQIKQVVVPELESINGVAHADVTGVRQQIVKITLDLKKVQAQGLNVSQIEGVLQANNITLPAG